MEQLTVQDLEIIKQLLKRTTIIGDDSFEYVRISNKIQTIINIHLAMRDQLAKKEADNGG
jgi:hypothetical protein